MKEIALIPDKPFHNNVDIAVMDFPKGMEDGTKRKRCTITVDFAQSDVEDLKAQAMDMDAVLKHYEEYIYQLVKVNIAMDWQCVEGWDEVMDIVREHVENYY